MKPNLQFSSLNIEIKQLGRFKDLPVNVVDEAVAKNFKPNACTVTPAYEKDEFKRGLVTINDCSIGHSDTIATLINRMGNGEVIPDRLYKAELIKALSGDLTEKGRSKLPVFQGETPFEFFNKYKQAIINNISTQMAFSAWYSSNNHIINANVPGVR